ncbi:hypothetical protein GGI13_006149, partial [Coemansia sp. RSA 455]
MQLQKKDRAAAAAATTTLEGFVEPTAVKLRRSEARRAVHADLVAQIGVQDCAQVLDLFRPPTEELRAMADTTATSAANDISSAMPIGIKEMLRGKRASEINSYKGIRAFFSLCGENICRLLSRRGLTDDVWRIVAASSSNYAPQGQDDSTRPDIVLLLHKASAEPPQVNRPAFDSIFTAVEVKKERGESIATLSQAAGYVRHILLCQHKRRFGLCLVWCGADIYLVIFGPDNIWSSTAMDISRKEGCQAFISLLVDWSLCPSDRLGFDPSIRYVLGKTAGDTYLEIDVYEVDESTSRVGRRTYYSKECIDTFFHLAGPHARYFAAAPSLESIDTPTLRIKDSWIPMSSDRTDDHFLDVIHKNFGNSSEFSGSFPWL